MVHHLLASSCDGNDLTELGALLNETVQLFTNALHSVAALGKVATIGATRPLPDGALVASGVTEAAIATVTTLKGDIRKDVLCRGGISAKRALGNIDLH